MNKRRTIIVAFGAGALVVPFGSFAQQPVKVARLGVLMASGDANSPNVAAFRDELHKLGWIEGKNIVIEYRSAGARNERLAALATELGRLKADVIVTASTPSALAAKSAIRDVPIVFSMVSDPVASGIVSSLARPGENITGWSNLLPETSAKLLELIKEIVPKASRVAVLWDPSNPGKQLEIKVLQSAAQRVRLTLQSLPVRDLKEIESAFSAMPKERADGVVVLQDNVTGAHRGAIAQFAARVRLPSIYQVSEFVDAGGLVSYGINLLRQHRRTAFYVDKILKGAKPGELPVEQPTSFELVVNLKTAKALGIKIPQSILVRADKVIE